MINGRTKALLTHSMMTPAERVMGRFMRAPDHDGSGGGGKTFTQEQLDAAVAKATGDVDGLKAKVEELIGDNKKLKTDLRKTQDIKPEDVAAIEAERDKALSDLAAATKQLTTLTKERDTAAKALEAESAFTQRLLIQDGLKSALIANGVKDEDYLDMAVAKFAPGAKVVIEGEERKAVYGDKPLGDFIKEWAGSDAGKKVVAAPANSGGGAPGGKGADGAAKQVTRTAFDGMSQVERAAFAKEGGKVVDEAA